MIAPRVRWLLLGVVALCGCRAIVGVEDREPPEQAAGCVALDGIDGTCATCAARACCAEVEACAGDAACTSRQACRGACSGDPACRAACDDGLPTGETSSGLDRCLASACEADCGLACGGAGPPVLGCAPCGEACCAEATACEVDESCRTLRACRGACDEGDVSCQEQCAEEHAAGAALELSVEACVAQACDITADWSCLGSIDPATTAAPFINLLVQVQSPSALLEGVAVSACFDGFDCSDPLATGTTDLSGQTTLRIPVEGSFTGYLRVEGEGLVTSTHASNLPRVTDGLALVLVFTPAQLEDLLGANGLTWAPGTGLVFVDARDCRGEPAAGVALRGQYPGGELEPAYGTTPQEGPPETGQTTSVGTALFLDVPPGYLAIDGEVVSLCRTAGAIVPRAAAGETSFVALWPSR
jgi:hypothetical protein